MMGHDDEQLKMAINNFIWMHGPDNMPLRDAERMAVEIFDMFLLMQKEYAIPDVAEKEYMG